MLLQISSKLLLANRDVGCPEFKYAIALSLYAYRISVIFNSTVNLLSESVAITNFIPNRNMHKVKAHPSLQKGGCHEVHDIEDLVKVGQIVRGQICTL